MISSFGLEQKHEKKRIGIKRPKPYFSWPFFGGKLQPGKLVNLKLEKSGALSSDWASKGSGYSNLLYKQHDLKMVPASYWPILFVSGDFDTRTSWKWEELPQSTAVRYFPELILAYLLENLRDPQSTHGQHGSKTFVRIHDERGMRLRRVRWPSQCMDLNDHEWAGLLLCSH